MLIALDFDKTYTLDPEFWDVVIAAAASKGHTVICATMRHEHEGAEVIEALAGKVDRIIFTGRLAKLHYLKNIGINPCVWIDDSPHWLLNNSG